VSEPVWNDDFRDLLRELEQAGVRFLLVGAHALAVHGLPRATGDLDLFVARDRDNAERLIVALERFGAPIAAHGLTAADFERPGTVYQLGNPPRRIDLLSSIDGVDFATAEASAIWVAVEGQQLPVLSREHLLANKLASGRTKDLADAEWLRGNAGPS
jgi:hypothetical protein